MGKIEPKRPETTKVGPGATEDQPGQDRRQTPPPRAEDDDITMGDEAQARRDKMQRQEKAEGERR